MNEDQLTKQVEGNNKVIPINNLTISMREMEKWYINKENEGFEMVQKNKTYTVQRNFEI